MRRRVAFIKAYELYGQARGVAVEVTYKGLTRFRQTVHKSEMPQTLEQARMFCIAQGYTHYRHFGTPPTPVTTPIQA